MNLRYVCLLLAIFSGPTARAQADTRFDGTWVGIETLTPSSKVNPTLQKSFPSRGRAIIVIAENAKLLGVVQGRCPGRYDKVRCDGDVLKCSAGDCAFALTLSRDGKTLVETGSCKIVSEWLFNMNGAHIPVTWLSLDIKGTFHRAK
jgi:hypothetical protein